MKDKDRIADKEQAEGSRETVNAALQQRKDLQQGVTNRPVVEERNQQEKLPSRNENQEQDESTDTPTSYYRLPCGSPYVIFTCVRLSSFSAARRCRPSLRRYS